MAKTARPRAGGKLALFEVLHAANESGGSSSTESFSAVGSDRPEAPADVAAPRVRPAPEPAAPNRPIMQQAVATQPVRPTPTHHGFGGTSSSRTGGLLRLGFDPSEGRVGVSTSYIGAALIAAAATAALSASFLAGRVTAGPGTASTPEEATLAMSDPLPEVMDVGDNAAPLGRPAPAARLATIESTTATANPAGVARQPQPVTVSGPVKRVAGMNYVLVQSFAASENKHAEATVAALRAAGINATIETNVRGWGKRLCVFGTQPFERVTNNPAYRDYIAKLLQVSHAHERDPLVRRFDPLAVQWGR